MVMLDGMAGLNGVSLPPRLEEQFGALLGNTFIYSGFAQGIGLVAKETFSWLLIGLSIVWFLPNTQEWMANFAPASESVYSGSRFAWKPTRRNAVLVGVLFCVSLLYLKRNSDFLYFQF
jgi:hypothetical protein